METFLRRLVRDAEHRNEGKDFRCCGTLDRAGLQIEWLLTDMSGYDVEPSNLGLPVQASGIFESREYVVFV